jgi:hypothetical protein
MAKDNLELTNVDPGHYMSRDLQGLWVLTITGGPVDQREHADYNYMA